ncbi:MAG TPA: hypothetical protein VD790_05570 [Thermoleophilaceae bacterium]|nr:hypothetical protein [Thermoleophilaceae bacterium]
MLVGLAALPLFAAAPAQAAKKMEVAIQDDGVFLYKKSYYDREAAFRQARELGVSRIRMNVLWSRVMTPAHANAQDKPSAVAWEWSLYDSAVDRARAYGLKVQLALTGDPPRWACGRDLAPGDCDGYKPDVQEFGEFAREAAEHFKGRVDRFSIWNEPNWHTWLSPLKQGPLIYRKLYQAGYKAIKGESKRIKVLMGELAPEAQKRIATAPLRFLREMVCVNKRFKKTKNAKKKCKGKMKLDGFAHHPYDFTVKPTKKPKRDNVTMANLDDLVDTLDRLQKKRLIQSKPKKTPIYLTEHGYYASGSRARGEAKRKKWTVQAFNMAQKHPRVKTMLYYILVSPPPNDTSAFFDLGIVETDGTETPTFKALKKWSKNAARDGKVAKPGRCSAC